MARYGKKEFVDTMAELTGSTKVEAAAALEAVKDTVKHLVKDEGDILLLQGFVRFEKKAMPARTYRNPQTGEKIFKDEHTKVKAQAKFE